MLEGGAADLCLQAPRRDLTLVVDSTVRALTEIWVGDRTSAGALQSRELRVDGPPREAARLWAWLGTCVFPHSGRRVA